MFIVNAWDLQECACGDSLAVDNRSRLPNQVIKKVGSFFVSRGLSEISRLP